MSEPFILVFRPHRSPAWAEAFESEEDFISNWANGYYDKSCACNNNLSEDESEHTYENAFADARHDLHSITRLESKEEVLRYINDEKYYGSHNKGVDSAWKAAVQLGWLEDESE
jgi:hypothetical protein